MLYPNTLFEIENNINTGVEYEIALFYQLAPASEQSRIMAAVNKRADKSKVKELIKETSTTQIVAELSNRGFKLVDVSFETQKR